MHLLNNTILNTLLNLNDESGYKFLIQVLLIMLCIMFLYNNTNAQSGKVKGNIINPGSMILSNPSEDETPEFSLKQNEPNPVFDTTYISYNLSEKSRVVLEIYNDRIDTVAILVNAIQEKGNYHIPFCTKNENSKIPGGVYFYRLKVTDLKNKKKNEFVDVKKMIVVE